MPLPFGALFEGIGDQHSAAPSRAKRTFGTKKAVHLFGEGRHIGLNEDLTLKRHELDHSADEEGLDESPFPMPALETRIWKLNKEFEHRSWLYEIQIVMHVGPEEDDVFKSLCSGSRVCNVDQGLPNLETDKVSVAEASRPLQEEIATSTAHVHLDGSLPSKQSQPVQSPQAGDHLKGVGVLSNASTHRRGGIS